MDSGKGVAGGIKPEKLQKLEARLYSEESISQESSAVGLSPKSYLSLSQRKRGRGIRMEVDGAILGKAPTSSPDRYSSRSQQSIVPQESSSGTPQRLSKRRKMEDAQETGGAGGTKENPSEEDVTSQPPSTLKQSSIVDFIPTGTEALKTSLETEKMLRMDLEKRLSGLEKQFQQEREKWMILEKERQTAGTGEMDKKIQEMEQTHHREMESVQQNLSKARGTLRDALIARAKMERQRKFDALIEKQQKLGQIVHRRRGVNLAEFFQSGELLSDLQSKRDAVAARVAQLQKEKRFIRRRRNAMTSESSSTVSLSAPQSSSSGGLMVPDGAEHPEAPLSARDLYVKEEQCQLGIQLLKEEEQEISQRIEEFEKEKAVLICDLKWMRDQSESHFRDFPSLNHGQYLILELLGKGGFSEVHRGYDLHNCIEVACKVHQLRNEWSQERKHNYARHSMREYHIQSRLRHPNVVRLYDVFEIDQDSFCTVMEYIDGVDLDQFLKKNKNMSEKDAKAVLLQILCGVKYLHEQKQRIIHYDMKPANILMHEGTVKITDFGLSKVMEEESDKIELTSQGAGTYWYLPPECFVMDKDKVPKISPKVDVWAVGIIFYEMLYGRRPFGDGMTQQGLLFEGTILKASAVEFQPAPGIKASVSEEAKEFIQMCLQPKEEDRPGISDLLDAKYLQPLK